MLIFQLGGRLRCTSFVVAVRTGKPLPAMVSPEFNLDVMRIVEAARLSAASGKPVPLP